MTTHNNGTWSSAEVASNSPLATLLRELAPAHNLYTTTTQDIQRRMQYSARQNVITEMRKLQKLGVIRFETDGPGKGSSLTFRVIMDAHPEACVGSHVHKRGHPKVTAGSSDY